MGLAVRLQTWTLVLSLLGCAATTRSGDAPASAQTPEVTFQVRSRIHGAEEWQPLSAEDVVHSGDHVALAIQTTSPVYVYVGRAVTDLPIKLLFPEDSVQPTQLKPGKPLSVPTNNDGFELGTQVGEESLYLVASEVPLAGDRVKELMATAQAAELGQSRPRPPTTSNGNRGAQSFPPKAGAVYRAKSLSPGLLAVRFVFQHQQ